MNYTDQYFILVPKFYFAGFVASGYELAKNGWEVSHYFDFRDRQVCQFVLRHSSVELYGYGHIDHRDLSSPDYSRMVDPVVHINMVHGRSRVAEPPRLHGFDQPSFSPIDFMQPPRPITVHDFFNNTAFAKVNVSEDFEIYLNKKDEKEVLDLLLAKQDKKQKEIRQNQRRRSHREAQEIDLEPAQALVRVV